MKMFVGLRGSDDSVANFCIDLKCVVSVDMFFIN